MKYSSEMFQFQNYIFSGHLVIDIVNKTLDSNTYTI